MSDPVDYVRLTQLAAEATPGPWIVGDRWHVAGVMPEKFGDGRCAKCNSGNPVVWEGRRDINGTKMQAHVHQSPEPWYGDGHQIFAYDGGPSRVTIAGNYDYEEGGILSPADCEFIAAASPDVVTRLLADRQRLQNCLNDLLSPSAELVECCAAEAFFTDDIGGHHAQGPSPHTWENIPEEGRENYRTLVRAVLDAAGREGRAE